MNDREILFAINTFKEQFGPKCGKYSGALTVELIRSELENNGIQVSRRDVFIQGVPLEIDFLIPRRNAKPLNGLVYQPTDVLAVVEVKNAGSFGNSTIQTIRQNFKLIKEAIPSIFCCYLTLSERKGFKWAITDNNSGGKTYTMF